MQWYLTFARLFPGAAKCELPKTWTRVNAENAADFELIPFEYYVRVKTEDSDAAVAYYENAFGTLNVLTDSPKGTVEFVTKALTKSEFEAVSAFGETESVIRILG